MNINQILFRFVPCLTFLAATQTVIASAPPPCIRVTLSANAEILVINDLTLDQPDVKTSGRKILASTFHVLSHSRQINDYMRATGPNTYWSDPLWSVEFDIGRQSPIPACPYTLVTNDGEFLILLGDLPSHTVMRIYRRRDHPGQPFGGPGPDHGVLVREIPIGALWPPERIPIVFKEGTPPWFAFGTFTFSSDSRTLIYKTQWRTTLKISLFDGAVATR